MSVKDKNNIPKFKKRLQELRKRKIEVGILGDKELALIGGVNEFGARIPVTTKMRYFLMSQGLFLRKDTKYIIIPERSWLRTAFDDKKNIKMVVRGAERIFDIDVPLKTVLDQIGLLMVAAVQKKIRSNIPPGNHPFTTEKKGGKTKTLINTGRLIQGVTHKVA